MKSILIALIAFIVFPSLMAEAVPGTYTKYYKVDTIWNSGGKKTGPFTSYRALEVNLPGNAIKIESWTDAKLTEKITISRRSPKEPWKFESVNDRNAKASGSADVKIDNGVLKGVTAKVTTADGMLADINFTINGEQGAGSAQFKNKSGQLVSTGQTTLSGMTVAAFQKATRTK